jgi:uncharacterized membrane protein
MGLGCTIHAVIPGMNVDEAILVAVRAVEVAGIAALLLGAILASAAFLRDWFRAGLGGAYHSYRANLGRAILLGLELLIIADIIRTVTMEPTLTNLAILGGIVLIRTFLSIALEVEIGGAWPWRRHPSAAPHEPPSR